MPEADVRKADDAAGNARQNAEKGQLRSAEADKVAAAEHQDRGAQQSHEAKDSK